MPRSDANWVKHLILVVHKGLEMRRLVSAVYKFFHAKERRWDIASSLN